jgi:hypothetical protein
MARQKSEQLEAEALFLSGLGSMPAGRAMPFTASLALARDGGAVWRAVGWVEHPGTSGTTDRTLLKAAVARILRQLGRDGLILPKE